MLDFTKVKEAIINDLKPICVQNYLILKELNYLPKEVSLIIAYNCLQISNELISLKEDIEHSHKSSFRTLIDESNIDILSEYNQYFNHLPTIIYFGELDYYKKKELRKKECIDILYCLDKNIYYKLLFRYINKYNYTYKYYEDLYRRNILQYQSILKLKTTTKYRKFLQIINLNNFLEFS